MKQKLEEVTIVKTTFAQSICFLKIWVEHTQFFKYAQHFEAHNEHT